MTPRVAFGGLVHETNTFAPAAADLDAFRHGGGYMPWCEGADIVAAAEGINLGISGALAAGARAGWDRVPVLWAGAIPSAHVAREAFETLAGRLLDGIAAAGPLSGVCLDLHGAMVCEHLDDGEGELVARVRDLVGPDVPITASLDLHGNISERLVDAADAVVGFRTYPHVDMAETGARAASLLDRMMRDGARPAKAYRRLPYLVPIPWQCTMTEPARDLYDGVARQEAAGAVSASLFMGFPAADIPDCGATAIAYGADQPAADRAADALAEAYAAAEPAFAGRAYSAREGVEEALRLRRVGLAGPIVLADTQDNPGAGGVSATTGMLRALLAAGARNAALGLMVDPAAARAAHAAGEGARLSLDLGSHPDLAGDAPLRVEAEVLRLSDGRLVASGGYYGGARLDLGPSACLAVEGVRVVVTSRVAQLADREMFRFVGIAPEEADILVVKSSTHFRADFAPVAGTILVCMAPGPMPLDPADLPWTRLRPGLRLSPRGPAWARPDAPPAARPGPDPAERRAGTG